MFILSLGIHPVSYPGPIHLHLKIAVLFVPLFQTPKPHRPLERRHPHTTNIRQTFPTLINIPPTLVTIQTLTLIIILHTLFSPGHMITWHILIQGITTHFTIHVSMVDALARSTEVRQVVVNHLKTRKKTFLMVGLGIQIIEMFFFCLFTPPSRNNPPPPHRLPDPAVRSPYTTTHHTEYVETTTNKNKTKRPSVPGLL